MKQAVGSNDEWMNEINSSGMEEAWETNNHAREAYHTKTQTITRVSIKIIGANDGPYSNVHTTR